MGMLLFTFILCTTGCGKDLSETASQMLQTMTPKFIDLQGIDKEKRLVTIDISDFSQYPIEDYQKWVIDTYTNENTVIVLFTHEDECFTDVSEADGYLSSNGYETFTLSDYDWTAIRISCKDSVQQIKANIKCQIDISYPLIYAIEGFEIKMKYRNETWSVDQVLSNYIS